MRPFLLALVVAATPSDSPAPPVEAHVKVEFYGGSETSVALGCKREEDGHLSCTDLGGVLKAYRARLEEAAAEYARAHGDDHTL